MMLLLQAMETQPSLAASPFMPSAFDTSIDQAHGHTYSVLTASLTSASMFLRQTGINNQG
jgi:hypothetical protein